MSDEDVRAELSRFLAGDLTTRDLQRWFAPIAWRLGEEPSPDLPLSRRVSLLLAEYTSGHWSEDELRNKIRVLTAAYASAPLSLFSVQDVHIDMFSLSPELQSGSKVISDVAAASAR